VARFARQWRAVWSLHGDAPTGWREYAALRDELDRELDGSEDSEFVRALLLRPALNPDLVRRDASPQRGRIERPVFIVAPLGSGADALRQLLARAAGVFTLSGDVEIAGEPIAATALALEERLYRQLRDRNGSAPIGRVRIVAAVHGSRIPLLRAMFPDALFIYLYRDSRAAVTAVRDSSTSAVDAAREWKKATDVLLDDLQALPPERWCVTSVDALAADPRVELGRIGGFVGFACEEGPFEVPPPPPLTEEELAAVEELTRDPAGRARELFARPPAGRVRVDARDAAAAFRSVHSASFAKILHGLGASLIVTTYQSGRVVILRAEDGKTLNSHLRMFDSPMGVAVTPKGIALGTRSEVWHFQNQPDVAAKLAPAGRHDACFVPRGLHVTGDIRIHEIAQAGGELWIVNTRFSTLSTLDRDYSFVPRWHPPFITELAAQDRCHLNGMAVVDGAIRYVTALGETNTDNGWRENKARGGIMIDVASGDIVLRGLSMPHSPRWYDGHLWLLESGKGTVARADLAGGRAETVAELPGFTRGLAFAGPFAFVGLSQVRESNIFGGIPLCERVQDRQCGIWVIDIRTFQTVAFLRFEGAVQEIFDVQVMHGVRYPELLELSDPLVAGSFVVPATTS
jgi:uncharacterized protein (TIGR03032 family)